MKPPPLLTSCARGRHRLLSFAPAFILLCLCVCVCWRGREKLYYLAVEGSGGWGSGGERVPAGARKGLIGRSKIDGMKHTLRGAARGVNHEVTSARRDRGFFSRGGVVVMVVAVRGGMKGRNPGRQNAEVLIDNIFSFETTLVNLAIRHTDVACGIFSPLLLPPSLPLVLSLSDVYWLSAPPVPSYLPPPS